MCVQVDAVYTITPSLASASTSRRHTGASVPFFSCFPRLGCAAGLHEQRTPLPFFPVIFSNASHSLFFLYKPPHRLCVVVTFLTFHHHVALSVEEEEVVVLEMVTLGGGAPFDVDDDEWQSSPPCCSRRRTASRPAAALRTSRVRCSRLRL